MQSTGDRNISVVRALLFRLSERHAAGDDLIQAQRDEKCERYRRKVLDKERYRNGEKRLSKGDLGEHRILCRACAVAEHKSDKAEHRCERTARETHSERAEQGHCDKSEYKASGLSDKHADAPAEGREYGCADSTECDIYADRGERAGQRQGKAAERDRKGLERYRDTDRQRD